MRKIVLCLLAVLLVSLVGSFSFADPVVLHYLAFRVGVQPEATSFAESVAKFNDLQKGKYQIVIDESVPEVMQFLQKLNMLYAAGDLPLIIDPLMQDPLFARKIFDGGQCVDLKPYIDADPQWKKLLLPRSIAACTEKNGAIYSAPVAYMSAIGIFYNKGLFAQAGVSKFPATWDEMFAALDKLKAKKIPGFLLETQGNAWTASLMMTALISRTQAGRDFMEIPTPTDFNKPFIVDALKDLKRLYAYATPDSVGANNQMTTSAFVSGRVAMQPNGPWHIPAMYPPIAPDGFAKGVGVAPYPGGVMLDHDSQSYSMAIASKYPKEQIAGAVEWMKFATSEWSIRKAIRDRGAVSPFIAPNADDKKIMSTVAIDWTNLLATPGVVKNIVSSFHVHWDSVTVNQTIAKYLPMLVQGQMTAEEMATKLSESAQNYVQNHG